MKDITDTKQAKADYKYAKQTLDVKRQSESLARRINKRAKKDARKAVVKYTSKKVVSFPARTISKGTVAVANALSKIGRKKT